MSLLLLFLLDTQIWVLTQNELTHIQQIYLLLLVFYKYKFLAYYEI
nr:MAG TPA: hypothetical protein [Bacteriophage sp.]